MAKKTSKAVAVRSGSTAVALPADLAAEYAPYIKRDVASSKGAQGWSFLKTRGAEFRLGEEVLGQELTVVVLGAIRENVFFGGKFNPDVAAGPSCFALDLAEDESKMAPPAELVSKQAEKCLGCEKNTFGSGDNGRGKACKNSCRLVLLNWNEGRLVDLEKGEGARLRVPVTSVRYWAEYAKRITGQAHRPLFTCVTKVKLAPHPQHQMQMTFSLGEFITERSILEVLRMRADEAEEYRVQIQLPSTEAKPAVQRGAGKTKGLVRKTVTRKTVARH